jgi:hypothetical protein
MFRERWSSPQDAHVTSGTETTPARHAPKREDLGTTTIQGVEAHGWRYTRTTPVGEVGNDQPLVNTQEVWTSPELGQVVRSVRSDPRAGTTTKELVSLDLGEPDPALFQPPEGYEMHSSEMHAVTCP